MVLSQSILKKQIILSLAILVFMTSLVSMGYFLPRSSFVWQLALFGLAFLAYWVIYQLSKSGLFSLAFGLALALVFRFLLLFAVPELSDDFYRFIFDGQLLKAGINPYSGLPEATFLHLNVPLTGYWEALMEGMNSRPYYSIYPPLHQLFFLLSSMGGENLLGNILILRLLIICFEGLNFYLLYKIVKVWDLPESKLWLYAFNPLVIIELTGNLHFEGIVLTGLLATVYFFEKKKLFFSNMGWIWAVGVKLTPLMLGPLLLKSWKRNLRWKFLLISAFWSIIFFVPLFFGDNMANYWQSFRLYQSKFEFNASVYYLVRWFSGFFIDYNPIASVGPFLNFLAMGMILGVGFFKKIQRTKDMVEGVLWIYMIYLLLQNVVHPWYIIPAFGLGVLTKNKMFLVWTGLIFLSYSAYADEMLVSENPFLLLLEYGILIGFIFWNYLKRFAQT